MKNELNIDELDAVTGGALSDAYSYAVAGAGLKNGGRLRQLRRICHELTSGRPR